MTLQGLQSQVNTHCYCADTATDWSGAEEAGSDTFSDYCSSWGSGEEVWGYETDYYDSEEEAEAVSGWIEISADVLHFDCM